MKDTSLTQPSNAKLALTPHASAVQIPPHAPGAKQASFCQLGIVLSVKINIKDASCAIQQTVSNAVVDSTSVVTRANHAVFKDAKFARNSTPRQNALHATRNTT
jgi:hypothetical protein